MIDTTYTVFRSQNSGEYEAGHSLSSAARELLTADGYDYEIRDDAKHAGMRVLWISDGSRNSPRGASHLRHSVYFGYSDDEIFAQVVAADGWHGMEAMTDDDFTAMLAQAAEE